MRILAIEREGPGVTDEEFIPHLFKEEATRVWELYQAAGRSRCAETRGGLAAVARLILGGLKAKYLFNRSCQRNLDRIAALDRPSVWQFFSPRFFTALTVMILVGVTLSRLAHNNYPFLIGVAILDIGIAIALLGSSHVFWKQKAFVK